jgi:hypothetical protein
MTLSSNSWLTKNAVEMLLADSCERCQNDAGFHSGMADAARCIWIEKASIQQGNALRPPPAWRRDTLGGIKCTQFCADVEAMPD